MAQPITLQEAIGLQNFFYSSINILNNNRESRRIHLANQLKILRTHLHNQGLGCLRFAAVKPKAKKVIPHTLFVRKLAHACPLWNKILVAKTSEEIHWHQVEPWVFCEPNRQWHKLGHRLVKAVKLDNKTGTWVAGYYVINKVHRMFVVAETPREGLKIYLGPRQIKHLRKQALFVRSARNISFDDAKRAGFCRSGTEAWCIARQIPIEDGTIPARALLPYLQDKQAQRVIDVLLLDAGKLTS
jgi:hypothetical protein